MDFFTRLTSTQPCETSPTPNISWPAENEYPETPADDMDTDYVPPSEHGVQIPQLRTPLPRG